MRIRMQGTHVCVKVVNLIEEVSKATAQHNWLSKIDMDVDMELASCEDHDDQPPDEPAVAKKICCRQSSLLTYFPGKGLGWGQSEGRVRAEWGQGEGRVRAGWGQGEGRVRARVKTSGSLLVEN